jgi:hypothetical protein
MTCNEEYVHVYVHFVVIKILMGDVQISTLMEIFYDHFILF